MIYKDATPMSYKNKRNIVNNNVNLNITESNEQSYDSEYVKISDKLAQFFGLSENKMKKIDVERKINEYIVANKLQKGLKIFPDYWLNKLLNPDVQLTTVNLHTYLSKHMTSEEDTARQLYDEIMHSTSIESDEKDESSVPIDNINLCFVGGVSTGKSTILNSIFCEQLTQCKIKRTTMVPTIYVENDVSECDTEDIYSIIEQKNKKIIELTESGEKLPLSEYEELIFNVGKLDINILEGSYVNVYDIPGLNDARTKSIYYKYLENNFKKFNLIVFIVDLHSGLNTSDEMEIVHFITNNTKELKENGNKNIYTLVVVNKADDMQLTEDEDNPDNDTLELTGELYEMYEQVEKTITSEFERKNVASNLIGIVPLCAIDSYLYRMVQKHGRKFKLSDEQMLKIGINVEGKAKFSKLPKDQKTEKVYKILENKDFIDTMIKLSGFGKMVRLLHKFLNENGNSKEIRIDNFLHQLDRCLPPSIPSAIAYANYKQSLMPDSLRNIIKHIEIYNMIKKIDEQRGSKLLDELFHIIMNNMFAHWNIDNKSVNTNMWIESYEYLYDRILNVYFKEFIANKWPTQLVKNIIGKINYELETNQYSLKKIQSYLVTLEHIDAFTKENVSQFLQTIVNNIRGVNTLVLSDCNKNELIDSFDNMQKLGVNINSFIRFIIVSELAKEKSKQVMTQKQMIFKKYDEIPIYCCITNNINNLEDVLTITTYCFGIPEPEKVLSVTELYYLTKCDYKSN
jgi:predicted GTPase